MARDEDGASLVGLLLWLSLIVTAVIMAVIACMTAGAAYGAGRSLWHYGLAFRRNVRPEGVSS